MNEKIVALLSRKRVVLDGSMGALLSSMGVQASCPDVVSVDNPDVIRSIHRAYIDAGADVILTDTFGSSPRKLERHGLSHRLGQIVSAAVENARAEAGEKALVALDVGPTGDMLVPMGTLSTADAVAGYRAQIQAGKEADFVLIETMTDIAEARSAMLAARLEGAPFAVSCSFEPSGRTMTGGTPACAAIIAQRLGAVAVGMNCSGGPAHMEAPLSAMRAVTTLPILVEPNAGLPVVAGGVTTYPLSPADFAEAMQPILQAGATAVGGCCGTTPDHIRRLAQTAKACLPVESSTEETEWVCSQRKHAPLAQALSAVEIVSDADDLYDIEEDTALAVLDLRDMDQADILDQVDIAATATHVPLGFWADDPEALALALREYAGVAAVCAPDSCLSAIDAYGAVRVAAFT